MADASSWATKPTPKVHDVRSGAGKFDDAFLASKDDEGKFDKPKHAEGTFPPAAGKETPYAKPTHATGTLIPNK